MRTGDQTVTGIINLQGQYANTMSNNKGWLTALFNRGQDTYRIKRSTFSNTRGLGVSFGQPVSSGYSSTALVLSDKRVIPMYIITDDTMAIKCNAMNITTPNPLHWSFNIMSKGIDQTVNSVAINADSSLENSKELLIANFSIIFSRPDYQIPDSPFLPKGGDFLWLPQSYTDLRDGDIAMGIRILPGLIGVYLVTSNLDLEASPYVVVPDPDPVVQQISSGMSRGLGTTLSTVYSMRGRGVLSYNTSSNGINEGGQTTTINTEYSDADNAPIQIIRNGSIIVHRAHR
jgi:hypothetical protein